MPLRFSPYFSLILLFWGSGLVVADGVGDSKYFDEWMARLSDPLEVHRASARRDLRLLGEKAVPILERGLNHSNYRVRLESIEIYCDLSGGVSLQQLEKWLVKETAIPVCHVLMERLICHYQKAGVESIRRVLNGGTRIESWRLRERYQEILAERVRELLIKLLTEAGTYGFYRDQFEEIVELGKDTSRVLLQLAENESVDPRLRILAAGALGDLGDRSVVHSLQRLYRTNSRTGNHSLKNILARSLARLGDPEAMNQSLRYYEKLISVGNPQRNDLFECASMNHRFGRHARALEIYRLLVDRYPGEGGAYYNIACIHSLEGNKEEALVALRKAFSCGYDDVHWARRDRDLEGIWKDPRFEAIFRGR